MTQNVDKKELALHINQSQQYLFLNKFKQYDDNQYSSIYSQLSLKDLSIK